MHRLALCVVVLTASSCVLASPDFDEGSAATATLSDSDATGSDASTSATSSATAASGATSSDAGSSGETSTTGDATTSTSESTTTGSTASTTTTDPTTTDSDSDSGAVGCGDGDLVDGEECDDGNLVGGDGCSALCHIEPTGISLSGLGFSMKGGMDAGNGQNVGGWCPDEDVMGWIAGDRDAQSDNWLCRPSFGCRTLTLGADLSVSSVASASFGPFDGGCFKPENHWERACGPDEVLVGFRGRAGTLIDQLVVRCAEVVITEDANGFSITRGEVKELPAIGGDGGNAFGPIDCPIESIAVSIDLNIGSWINSVQMTCKNLALEY